MSPRYPATARGAHTPSPTFATNRRARFSHQSLSDPLRAASSRKTITSTLGTRGVPARASGNSRSVPRVAQIGAEGCRSLCSAILPAHAPRGVATWSLVASGGNPRPRICLHGSVLERECGSRSWLEQTAGGSQSTSLTGWASELMLSSASVHWEIVRAVGDTSAPRSEPVSLGPHSPPAGGRRGKALVGPLPCFSRRSDRKKGETEVMPQHLGPERPRCKRNVCEWIKNPALVAVILLLHEPTAR
jgi:hypothetical protein